MSGLVELIDENQELLAHAILMTMDLNGFKVDGVKINFMQEEQNDHQHNTGH